MIKYIIKDFNSGAYLAQVDDFNKSINPQQRYGLSDNKSILKIALFDTEEEAIKAYEEYRNGVYEYAGIIEKIITF